MHKRLSELEQLIEIKSTEEKVKKFLTIISLKNINDTSIKKVLPLIICKELYDIQKSKPVQDGNYLNFIIDEAHNILSHSSIRESEQWKDYRLETFEEIIKEGRKFGVFLTIASQRPSDISPTILSQLHNYFLHRLINNNDIFAVEKTISYLDKVSFDSLPILPTGTCILAGLAAQVPVVMEIDKISDDNKPRNQTIKPTDFWI
jgi:DNA helicase HerA-like ATPase